MPLPMIAPSKAFILIIPAIRIRAVEELLGVTRLCDVLPRRRESTLMRLALLVPDEILPIMECLVLTDVAMEYLWLMVAGMVPM